ncbi:MAG TPA: M81 family metallopeptidase [Bacteroidales bacterium]|nr:M81 family metallopeptidase [Bacteroidales bacterium]
MNHAEKFFPCGIIKTLFSVLLTMAALSWPIAASGQGYSARNIPNRQETFRIGIVSFMHETCTFCPEPATLEDWLATGSPTDNFLGENTGYIGGFEARMEAYGGVELVAITSPAGMPVGSTSRSWNSMEVWEYFTSLILQDIKEKGPFDGVLIALHGAMAVVGIARPEAELLRMVRNAVGPDVVLIVTLDLHANVDAELVADDAADAVFSVKRFPHYDDTLTGQMAADVMIRTLQGTYNPVVATRKPGIITPSIFQSTAHFPARDIMERARRWENRETDVYVSVNFGFAYADVPDNGASIFVVTNNDPELANRIADDMNEYFWRHREAFVFQEIYNVEDGVRRIMQAVEAGRTPVVVADGSDRTGGATWITNELIRQGASNFCIGTLTDEAFFQKVKTKGLKPGERIGPVRIGGTTDTFAGEPVELSQAVVEFMDERHLVLLFGNNNRIVVTPELRQITDPRWHARVGIDFEKLDIVVHKTRVHFLRGYFETGIAGGDYQGTIVKIDVPGWGPADIRKINFVNGGQYLYPLVLDREMGHVWDRPFKDADDMIFKTGEGLILR